MARPALTFLGGAGTVTGSKHLVDTGTTRLLLDCGLYQGLSTLRRRNWQPPGFGWQDLAAVVLTHAHLDHCGYLPVLARHGWRGPVYATEGTARLAEIVLADSAHLMEEEAAQANAGGWTKHRPAVPLYDRHDAALACRLLRPVPAGEPVELPGGVTLTFGRAGHILGSSWARLAVPVAGGTGLPVAGGTGLPGTGGERTLLVSGDLGRPGHPVLAPPQPRPVTDVLLLESTYGARAHADTDARQRLAGTIRRAARRGGSVLIPAFAVDRTEVMLVELARLRQAGEIPDLPVVVDSPMALACLRVYREAVKDGWPEIRPELADDPFEEHRLVEVQTAEESARWNDPRLPAILISASGMATGGRVLHHLRHMLPDHRHAVVVVGFAAAGTRARQLVDGAPTVKIHGRYVPVRAEVLGLDAFSAHADAAELYGWATAAPPPATCYLVHGEDPGPQALAGRLRAEAGWTAVVPREGERVLL